jgi:hypothetical protein
MFKMYLKIEMLFKIKDLSLSHDRLEGDLGCSSATALSTCLSAHALFVCMLRIKQILLHKDVFFHRKICFQEKSEKIVSMQWTQVKDRVWRQRNCRMVTHINFHPRVEQEPIAHAYGLHTLTRNFLLRARTQLRPTEDMRVVFQVFSSGGFEMSLHEVGVVRRFHLNSAIESIESANQSRILL